jgi:hypothetical protein
MTVRELITHLESLPENYEVCIVHEDWKVTKVNEKIEKEKVLVK